MKHLAITLAAGALLLAGCQSPHSSGQSSFVAVEGDQVVSASLQIDDAGLSRHVVLTGATTQLLRNGLLRVESRLCSTDHRDYSVQCKYRWFDDAGMEITTGGGSPWIPVFLHGGESVPVPGVSPRPGVTGFTLSVRHFR